MGRSLFPVLVFGIVLIAALAAILAINYSLNPYSAATQENVLGRTSFIGPPPEDLSAIFAPADDPFTAHAEYVQVSYSYTSDNKTVLEFIVKDEPGVKQYIYNEGYYSINNAWVKFTFPNATASGTKWIRGNASVRTAPLDVTTFTNHFAIVYVCRKYSDSQQFICGPKGASKNPNVRNWTVVQFYTWPPQAPPTIVYVCANTPGAFCAQTNTTPDANRTLWQSPFGMIAGGNTQFLQCPSGQSCFKCIDGFVNQSNGQCVGTCELMTGQFCATTSNGTPNSTGTCSPGKSCYSCPSGTQRQGDNCVQVTQCTPTCTTENARQCAASTPQLCSDTDAGTGVCLKWVDQTACTSTQTCSSGNCLSNCAATTGQFCATNPLAANIASGYCSSGSCYSCPSGMTFNAQANACQAPPPTCTQTNGGVEICDNIDNNCNNQVDENVVKCGLAGAYGIAAQRCNAGSWSVIEVCASGTCNGNVCGAAAPTCSYSGTDPNIPIQCSTCPGKPNKIPMMINSGAPYAIEGTYYGQCCAQSTDCADASSCFPTGTIHPEAAFNSKYLCYSNVWRECRPGEQSYTVGSTTYTCDTNQMKWVAGAPPTQNYKILDMGQSEFMGAPQATVIICKTANNADVGSLTLTVAGSMAPVTRTLALNSISLCPTTSSQNFYYTTLFSGSGGTVTATISGIPANLNSVTTDDTMQKSYTS